MWPLACLSVATASAVHFATTSGNIKVLQALLEEGANLNIANRWGESPLHAAVAGAYRVATDLLTKAGARLMLADSARALCVAAAADDVEQVSAVASGGKRAKPALGWLIMYTALYMRSKI